MQRLLLSWLLFLVTIDALTRTLHIDDVVSNSTFDRKPHIILTVADDLGWHDVGFHDGGIDTPVIDRFAREGRRLRNYYAQPTCSPTRATIMTGRHTTSHGVTLPFDDGVAMGLMQSENLLPQTLAAAGYKTHAVGKWHLGFFKDELTPTFKGFDSFYGFYGQGEDYVSHEHQGAFDFRLEEGRNCGSTCSIVDFNASGVYSTTLFTQRAKKVISDHNAAHPLFLYLAWQAVHAPGDSLCPEELTGKYSTSPRDARFSCGAALLDESLGDVVSALRAKNMLENSLVIFTSDNGGATSTSVDHEDDVGSSNWPLRGGKHTLFEGGVRVVGFAWAGWWNHAESKIYEGLMGTVDWFPTLLKAASVDNVPATLEGVSHWHALDGGGIPPRESLFISVSQFGFGYGLSYALRFGNFKLIVGRPSTESMGWGWSKPSGSDLRLDDDLPSFVFRGWNSTLLFNLEDDPAETKDLSDCQPGKVEEMMEMLSPYMKNGFKVYVENTTVVEQRPSGIVWTSWA